MSVSFFNVFAGYSSDGELSLDGLGLQMLCTADGRALLNTRHKHGSKQAGIEADWLTGLRKNNQHSIQRLFFCRKENYC